MTAASSIQSNRLNWSTIVMLTLSFWLSGSAILDWVIMPSLYVSGMMTQAGFATAGYLVFGNFNRVELLSAALVVTGMLVMATQANANKRGASAIVLALVLLAVSLTETYFLTPQMSALGLQLNLFESVEIPNAMNQLHAGYWLLETIKLLVGGTLLTWCFQRQNAGEK